MKFYIGDNVHPQSIGVIQTRGKSGGVDVVVLPVDEMDFSKKDVAGFLFQYPDTSGAITDPTDIIKDAQKYGVSSHQVYYIHHQTYDAEKVFKNDSAFMKTISRILAFGNFANYMIFVAKMSCLAFNFSIVGLCGQ